MLTINCLFPFLAHDGNKEKTKKSQQTTNPEENYHKYERATNMKMLVNIPVPAQRRTF